MPVPSLSEGFSVSFLNGRMTQVFVHTTLFQENRGSGLHSHQIYLWMGLLTALSHPQKPVTSQ